MHPRRVDLGVAVKDVGAHAVGHRDHRVRGLERLAFHERRHPVAAGELLGLPRPARFERVGGHDVRNAVHELSDAAAEVRVPGMAVHQPGPGHRRRDLDVRGEQGEGRIDMWVDAEESRIGLGVGRGTRPRIAETVHVDVDLVGELGVGQRSHELGHVHAGAAVDGWWVLAGEQADTHPVLQAAMGMPRLGSAPPADCGTT